MNELDTECLNARIAKTLQTHRQRAVDPESGRAYTQRAFAKAIGLSRTTVSNVESRRQLVSLDYLYRCALALKLSLDDLLPSPSEVIAVSGTSDAKQHHDELEDLLARRINLK